MTISPLRSLLGLTLVLAACGGDLTLPPEGAAARIEVLAEGNNQSGRVGETLPLPLVVRVTDSRDRPVANANVVFTIPDGVAAGEVSPASAATDADGRASATLKLGSRTGPVVGRAAVSAADGVQASFNAMSLAANANGIALVSGDPQTGAVGTTLPAPLVVVVADAFGNPIPNVAIEWSVNNSGGSVSNATTLTGDNGQASVTRTLGPTAGQQTTLATAAGLAGSPVTFTHTASAGTAATVVKIAGDVGTAPAGSVVEPVVEVRDAGGNPISGASVTWLVGEGGGGATPTSSNANGQGRATTRWTLGSAPGTNTLNVVSGTATARFTVTGTSGGPSASNSIVAASPSSITAGTGSSTITVTVRDAGNNPVAGVSVTPASSGSENTFNPSSASTGTNGVATFTFSSTVAESKTITATAGGVAITDQATVNVQKGSSTVEITSDDDDPSRVGEDVIVEFTVSGSGGTPTGDVVITVSDGPETCTGTLSNGSGSCRVRMTQQGTGSGNRRVITATYAGDARFSGDTDTENHRVDPAPGPVNQAPVANNDPSPSDAPYTTPGGGLALVVSSADGVLKNDTDPDGNALTAGSASTPGQGSVVLSLDGSFTYTPNVGAAGNDSFTYQASDGSLTSQATVSITINP